MASRSTIKRAEEILDIEATKRREGKTVQPYNHTTYSEVIACHAVGSATDTNTEPSDLNLGGECKLDGIRFLGKDGGGEAHLR